jgi:hypothetical protein
MMSLFVECSTCQLTYARILLSEDSPRCRCGAPLHVGPRQLHGDDKVASDDPELQAEEADLRELSRAVDYISYLIVSTDTPRVDIDIKSAALKQRCLELFPDKGHLFDLLYKSRFRRLWEQFRDANGRCLDRNRTS